MDGSLTNFVEVEIIRLKNPISSQSNIVFLVACLTQRIESQKLSDNQMDLLKYKTIIFDFDGVIVDSNEFKGQSIYKATLMHTDKDTAKEFTAFFTANNGVPREKKIFDYIKVDITAGAILDSYNGILEEAILDSIKLTEGFLQLMEHGSMKGQKKFVVSGGTESEVIGLLEGKGVIGYFDAVKGGPVSKYDNIKNLDVEHPCLYFGDSKLDFEVAEYFNYDFVFVSQYTQFETWKHFFSDKEQTKVINNFKELL